MEEDSHEWKDVGDLLEAGKVEERDSPSRRSIALQTHFTLQLQMSKVTLVHCFKPLNL